MNNSQLQTSKLSVEIECSVEGDIAELYLVFSLDSGQSWNSVKMEKRDSVYLVSIPNIERGVEILYLLKAISFKGEEYIENNNNQYFSQIAGEDLPEIMQNAWIENQETFSEENTINEEKYLTPQESNTYLNNKILEKAKHSEENSINQLPPEFSVRNNPFFEEKNNSSTDYKENVLTNELDKREIIKKKAIKNNANLDKMDEIKKDIKLEKTQIIKIDNKKKPNLNVQNLIRPIIAYNPYSPDYGDILKTENGLDSFSSLIEDTYNEPKEKHDSFISSPKIGKYNRCSSCKSSLKKEWKICPICGSK